MAHQWEPFEPFRFACYRWRRCVKCGAEQQYSSGSPRRLTSGGWAPKAGRCFRVVLRRVYAGRYETADGLFTVWQSCQRGYERRWWVNHRDFDETLDAGGFPTYREAAKRLRQYYVDRPTYLFGPAPGKGVKS